MPISYGPPYPYTQYTGIWKLNAASAAQGAGTWPVPPPPPHLFSWGRGTFGSLGLGNTTSYSSPKQVGSDSWSQVSSAYISSAAIKSDGTLWTFGSGSDGVLGLGNTTSYSSPKQVGALTNWAKISGPAGNLFIAAIKTDGTLWTWGNNSYGQLGLGDTTNRSSPTQVGTSTNWSKVACGSFHTLAIKTDGTLWSWGYNNSGAYGGTGQLGLGNTTNYSSPKQVGSLTDWLNVAGGTYHTVATKTDGTIWTWGWNGEGELGNGNTTRRSSPAQVGALTNWSVPSCGYYNSFCLKTDGTVWSWGENYGGSLGLGNTTYYSSPKQIGALTTWGLLKGGARSCGAIKTDGTLWVWGSNSSGQLGLGNTTYFSSPKQVGSLTSWLDIAMNYNVLAIAKI